MGIAPISFLFLLIIFNNIRNYKMEEIFQESPQKKYIFIFINKYFKQGFHAYQKL